MVALITGATSGIGKQTAIEFAKHGYDIVITGRRQDRLLALKTELESEYKVHVLEMCFDITIEKEVESAVNSLSGKFQNIDFLINNAGLAAGMAPIQNGNINHWEQMINTNIKGLLYVTKHISNKMIEQKKGHIINVGSIAGKEVYANGNCVTCHNAPTSSTLPVSDCADVAEDQAFGFDVSNCPSATT